jgi:hypothetical protein
MQPVPSGDIPEGAIRGLRLSADDEMVAFYASDALDAGHLSSLSLW